jgi:opacity protein-like surface antigen
VENHWEEHHMKKLALLASLILALAGGAIAASTAAAAPPASTAVAVPVTGTFTDALGGTGTFTGTYIINRAAKAGGSGLTAVGTLSGTLTDSAGAAVGTVTNQSVTSPLQATGTCEILTLTLGPLDLNLLGLRVQLNQVVLNITAEQGPGNLLGNLLCAVAGLLDPPAGGGAGGGLGGLLNSIVALLNEILGVIG